MKINAIAAIPPLDRVRRHTPGDNRMGTAGAPTVRHSYLDGPPRQVPGFSSLHRMVRLLLAERVPPDGRLLVLGAGGGMEIDALARDQPGWCFDGVDPSPEMLALAEQTVRPYRARVTLHEGYIDSAPHGPFDGATSLLTFHFIARELRLETLRAIRWRLKPGAPFVVMHISIPSTEPDRSIWLSRHLAFAGTPASNAEQFRQALRSKLSILSPEEDEALLREAGFDRPSLFYVGFSFRGWVAYA
jgi:tRNA (cmo5U34)-methyltransferase